ncbi:unnamed protein product [Cylicocyclus nassatus]|uniref:SCP domain-containing protein n=1 Tax=Cylicocyclus nassatus TaxID=53992 RepID=A0AA36MAL8_CYLNA|nr:unnamed protein product [Cylicocyclus nassatus]
MSEAALRLLRYENAESEWTASVETLTKKLISYVATGRAVDRVGGFTPPAARMYKLRYDCEMENLAVAHARKCQFKHSESSSRPGAGENIFAISPPGNKVEIGIRAAYAWAEEVYRYGVGNENVFTWELISRPYTAIGHYTQPDSLPKKVLTSAENFFGGGSGFTIGSMNRPYTFLLHWHLTKQA